MKMKKFMLVLPLIYSVVVIAGCGTASSQRLDAGLRPGTKVQTGPQGITPQQQDSELPALSIDELQALNLDQLKGLVDSGDWYFPIPSSLKLVGPSDPIPGTDGHLHMPICRIARPVSIPSFGLVPWIKISSAWVKLTSKKGFEYIGPASIEFEMPYERLSSDARSTLDEYKLHKTGENVGILYFLKSRSGKFRDPVSGQWTHWKSF